MMRTTVKSRQGRGDERCRRRVSWGSTRCDVWGGGWRCGGQASVSVESGGGAWPEALRGLLRQTLGTTGGDSRTLLWTGSGGLMPAEDAGELEGGGEEAGAI